MPASFAVISLFVLVIAVSQESLVRNRWTATVTGGYWAAMVVYIVGTKEVRYGSDMAVYLGQFARAAASPSLVAHLRSVESDRAFAAFQWGIARVGSEPWMFTLAVALVSVAATWLAARLLLPPPSAIVVLFACTVSPFFVSYATNTVRQGLASSILLAGVAALLSEERIVRRWGLVLVVLGPFVHLSAAVPAIIAVLLRWRPMRTSHCLVIWAVAAVSYVTGLNSRLLSFFGGGAYERLSQYARRDVVETYGGGVNRPDFLVLGLILVFGVVLLARTARAADPDAARRADFLVNLLILWNAYFLCMGFLAYSDRFAAYSWLLFPLCVGYLTLSSSFSRSQLLRFAFVVAPIAIAVYLQGIPDVIQQTTTVG